MNGWDALVLIAFMALCGFVAWLAMRKIPLPPSEPWLFKTETWTETKEKSDG